MSAGPTTAAGAGGTARAGLHRVWRRSIVRGLVATLHYGRSSARVHPTARLDGPFERIEVSPGARISEQCMLRIEPTDDGRRSGHIALGRSVWLAPRCHLEATGDLTIGPHTTVQRGSSFNGTVAIGARCVIAPNVFISSGSHLFDRWPGLPVGEQERRATADGGSLEDRPVRVGEDCWLGVNVVIAPGVTVGRGAIVGANSVVTRDVGPYEVVAGSPAAFIRHRLDWRPPQHLDATSEDAVPYLVSGFDLTFGTELSAVFGSTATLALATGPDSMVRVCVDATTPTRLTVAGVEHTIGVGRSELVAPLPQGSRPSAVDHVEVSLDALGAPVRLVSAESF